MRYIKGFLMAWGCFCRIPCPYRGWEGDNRYAMLNMFPLIGTALGVLAGVIWWLLSLLGVSSLFTADLQLFLDDGIYSPGRVYGLQRCGAFPQASG